MGPQIGLDTLKSFEPFSSLFCASLVVIWMGKRIGEKLSTVDHDDLTTEEWIKLYGSTSSYPNKVL